MMRAFHTLMGAVHLACVIGCIITIVSLLGGHMLPGGWLFLGYGIFIILASITHDEDAPKP